MKREIILFSTIFTLFTLVSCGGGDDGPGSINPPTVNTDPTAVSQLIYPSTDLLCIDRTITFQWSAASDADGDPISYKLVIAEDRNLTTIVQQVTVNNTSINITLTEGTAYYWNVTAIDNQGGEADPSSTFAFYTEGNGVSNHAPFTAAIGTPSDAGMVDAGTINLSWTGSDTDTGDTLTYDLYFGETMNPSAFQTDITDQNFAVTATTGLTYFWRVDTIDDSGVKTIGQVWSFSVN